MTTDAQQPADGRDDGVRQLQSLREAGRKLEEALQQVTLIACRPGSRSLIEPSGDS